MKERSQSAVVHDRAESPDRQLNAGRILGRTPLVLGVALLAATLVALPLDAWLAQWMAAHRLPAVVRKSLQLSEFFGHGLGVLMIGLLVLQLDSVRRWCVPRLVFAPLAAGLVADLMKVLVARLRPRYCGIDESVANVVNGWFVVAGEGKSQSFPSGHAAAAAAMAFALTALYPRGRYCFALLGLLAIAQRLDEGAHFLSDLCCGAAIGSFAAALCFAFGPLAQIFARREQQWRMLAARWFGAKSLDY